MRWLVFTLVLAACGHDHGPPRVQPSSRFQPSSASALRRGGPPLTPRIANYKLDAKLDVQRHQITGTELLRWTNTGESAVDVLPFHLYMNGFKNEATLFMRSSRGMFRSAHAAEGGWGWIQLDSVQIGGAELAGKLRYPGAAGDPPDHKDETVVEVPLAEPLPPGHSIEVSFRFTEQLPEVFARTGYKGDFHMVGQWFPKIGVRVGAPGNEHWECLPFHAFSEFFADFGTYDVTLTVPSTHMVAATGVLTAFRELPGGTRTLTYHAEDVHDFAWMADPYMTMISGLAKVGDGNVEVRVYFRPEQRGFAERHLQAGIGAIERFSADFLPYPWPVMSIIDPPVDAGGAGGMEYPTLVTTGGDSVFMRPGMRIPELVTVHEVGHNWFQGMLASNEPEEAWLDEGVNDWVDTHVMNDLYGPRHGIDWHGWQADLTALERAITESPSEIPSPIATATYAFVDQRAWAEQSYRNTERALATLEGTVGSARMMAAMKAYARAWAFRHPTGRDFYAVLSKELGQDLGWFFGPAFHDLGGLQLAIRSSTCRPAHPPRGVFGDGQARKVVTETEAPDAGAWECEVVVQSMGPVHVPVDLELKFADGSSERRTWDDRDGATWQRFVVDRSSRLVEVRLDPDGKLALDSPVTHAHRLEGDGAASLRAAARIASWAQTAMQLVGP
ncbi:MAG: M1 family metallopeptidase [Acidobacteriota bacterium]